MVAVLARLIALVRLVMVIMEETLELLSVRPGLQILCHQQERPFLLRLMAKTEEMEALVLMPVALKVEAMAAMAVLVDPLRLASIQQ
jgi:hypothetical protein